jgi:hypothetical protein
MIDKEGAKDYEHKWNTTQSAYTNDNSRGRVSVLTFNLVHEKSISAEDMVYIIVFTLYITCTGSRSKAISSWRLHPARLIAR